MGTTRTRTILAIAALLVLALTACSKPAARQPKPEEEGPPVTEAVTSEAAVEATAEESPDTSESPAPKHGIALDSDKGEKFGYARTVWEADGVVYLSVDYAEMLTGDAAAKAATQHGDESPPPNDYYIVNDNAKLRTFKLAKDADAKYIVGGEPGLRDLNGAGDYLAKWEASGADGAIRVLPYTLTIDGEAVTKLEQVYLP